MPDKDSILAIGENAYDSNNAAKSARAGFNQGIKEASTVYKTWS